MGTTEFLRDDYTVWNGPCRNKALAPSPDNTRDFARAAQLMSTPFNYLAAPSRPPLEDRGKIRNILGGKHWIWCLTTPFLPKSHPSVAPTAATPESTFPVEQQLTSSPRIFNWDKRRWWGTRGFVCPTAAVNHSKGLGISKHWLNPIWEHLYAALPLLSLGICSLEKSSGYFNWDV